MARLGFWSRDNSPITYARTSLASIAPRSAVRNSHWKAARQLQPCVLEAEAVAELIGVANHKGIGFHSHRHVNASSLDSLNVAASVRMDRLGHEDFRTTMGYTHSSSQDHLDVADKLGDAFCTTVDEVLPKFAQIICK
jgi:integrase